MKLWITAALIALMTVSTYPRAAKAASEITGNELLEWCESKITRSPADAPLDVTASMTGYVNTNAMLLGAAALGRCGGFIIGVADGFHAGFLLGTNISTSQQEPGLYCFPESGALFQLQPIVLKYFEAHPEGLYEDAVFFSD